MWGSKIWKEQLLTQFNKKKLITSKHYTNNTNLGLQTNIEHMYIFGKFKLIVKKFNLILNSRK